MEESTNTVMPRKKYLDIARGICIICMIICHAFAWSQRGYIFTGVTGTWFLVFFFFSSGLCYNNRRQFCEYVKYQAKKLLLPYTVTVAFYLLYRIHCGMLWDYTPAMKIKFFLASLCTALPADFQDVSLFHINTIGIGPIWFFPCMFISGILYRLLYSIKGKLIISVVLAGLATISQKYIVLPFTLQNACIGCMFIALGDSMKDIVSRFAEWMKSCPVAVLAVLCIGAFAAHCFILINTPYQILNLGGNVYSLCSLLSTFSGFLFLILLAVLIERTYIIDEFLAFYGRNTLLTVVFHTVDILIVRNWSMRDNSFLIGTLLLYPFMVYIYQRVMQLKEQKKHVSICKEIQSV